LEMGEIWKANYLYWLKKWQPKLIIEGE